MKLTHRMHGTTAAGESGTLKGIAFSGLRHPAQHTRDGSPEDRVENGAWFAVTLPMFAFLTVLALGWDALCWTLGGWLFGVLFFVPVAYFGAVTVAGCIRLVASWRSR